MTTLYGAREGMLQLPDVGLRDLHDILSDHEFWAEQKAKVLRAIEPEMRKIFREGMNFAKTIEIAPSIASRIVGARDFLDPDEGDLEDAAGQIFRTYTDNWWSQLSHTMQNGLRNAITEAAADGSGTPGVIKRISPLFGQTRAKRIGVTETTRLFGRGAQATYQASGVEKWTWHTVRDARVCPICEGLNGTEYPTSHPFDPAHVLCRCFPSPA